MGILQTIVLSLVFGALGVALAVYLLIRYLRGQAEDEDDEEGSGGEWIGVANGENVGQVGRVGLLEFTNDSKTGVPWAVPVNRIEYVARIEDGTAYIGCYRVKHKKEFYIEGYHTRESYEEIIKRLKGKGVQE